MPRLKDDIYMNFTRVKAIANKEFIQILRDPRSLALAFAIPILLLLLFGYALNLDVDNIPIAIWDQDNTRRSVEFIFDFQLSHYFQVEGYYDNYQDLIRLIDRDKILMALIIPKEFSRRLGRNQNVPVQFLIDGSDSNTATIARSYLDAIVKNYNARYIDEDLPQLGIINATPVDYRSRPWFNPNFESRVFIIPGLIAIIIMVIAALLTSLTVAREWERGTMEQLISTPVKSNELILGKFIPYFMISFIDLTIAVIMAKFIFAIPLIGNLFLLFVLSSLFITGALIMGIWMSIVGKTQLAASQLAILATFMPTFLLSGFVYPIYNMPKLVQAVTYFVPARYFIVILRGIFLKGVGIGSLWPQVVYLTVFALLMIILANHKFKKKVA